MTDLDKARALARRIRTKPEYRSAIQIACDTPLNELPDKSEAEDVDPDDLTLGDYPIFLGQGDYPMLSDIGDRVTEDANAAANTITSLTAEVERMRAALIECQETIDEYVQQEYPFDHPVHERYRKRDFAANPARIALSQTGGE